MLIPLQVGAQDTDWFQKGLEAGDPADQILFFTRSIESETEPYASYFCRASARLGLGDVEGAIADFSKCIELDSADTDAWYSRGMAKQRIALNYQDAVYDLARALENKSTGAMYVFWYNRPDLHSESCRDIILYYDKILIHFPADETVYTKLGFCRLAGGDYAGALDCFLTSVTLDPAKQDAAMGAAIAFHFLFFLY